ncbi:hypothetical protein BpHYR1_031003 [Brachionus plicatilis]|uniref:Uncharacterized protein n=1 Tax=Brachionus plicatilis TaxID=10195 RepID=A0A3M7SUC9_BRAPC|nr:hypothetical protein BpHYR1_031003 [Brachionus plicatilis]
MIINIIKPYISLNKNQVLDIYIEFNNKILLCFPFNFKPLLIKKILILKCFEKNSEIPKLFILNNGRSFWSVVLISKMRFKRLVREMIS